MKRRILTVFACILAAAIGATAVLMTLLTYGMFERWVMDDLRVNARLLGAYLDEEEGSTGLEAIADDLRVTLVRKDGTVFYDNSARAEDMDNHADRPEIAGALESGEGRDVRDSATVEKNTFYYAIRLGEDAVLRVAREASSIWSIYLRAMPLSLVLLVVMMGLSVLVASMLTRRLIAPIEQMTARLDHLDGVTCYPELEPFMNMIKSQHEEILRSADMRVEFTANVSHELKTPLTSISGYAELIESGMATGEQARRFAGEIHKSSNRLLTLINDIIRLSQMDAPAQELTMETVDMAQIAANTVEQLRLNARKSEVTLALDARSAPIQADRRMMEELVYNLCDNAIRYNVRGGSVRVVVHPAKEKVLVSVQDTGIGISKEHQAHVFERFFRVDKSRSKATGGTGLGLAIVKHIAAKHGAQIQIDSELGSGTTITVTFARRLPDRPARP